RQRDRLLGDRSDLLGLGQGRADLLVPQELGHEPPVQGDPRTGLAAEATAGNAVTHSNLLGLDGLAAAAARGGVARLLLLFLLVSLVRELFHVEGVLGNLFLLVGRRGRRRRRDRLRPRRRRRRPHPRRRTGEVLELLVVDLERRRAGRRDPRRRDRRRRRRLGGRLLRLGRLLDDRADGRLALLFLFLFLAGRGARGRGQARALEEAALGQP